MPDTGSTQYWPQVWSATAASCSAFAAFVTWRLSRKLNPLTVSGKLMDREYELNKLALQYAEAFDFFIKAANRKEPYFKSLPKVVERCPKFRQVQAIAYYQLDFFEEIFLASKAPAVHKSFDSENWMAYIDRRMRHKLLQELFDRDKNNYRGEFATYLQKNWSRFQVPCDDDGW